MSRPVGVTGNEHIPLGIPASIVSDFAMRKPAVHYTGAALADKLGLSKAAPAVSEGWSSQPGGVS